MRKGLLYGGGAATVLVAIVVVVLVVVLASLDGIVAAAIERVGSDVTETDVTVEGVDISTRSGTGAIRGLVVDHPEGFESRVMRIEEASLAIDLESVAGDTIRIRDVRVTGPEVTVEVNAQGTNLQALQRSLRRDVSADATPDDADPEDGRKLVVDRLTISGGRVRVVATGLMRDPLSADLPQITLRDIGKDTGGASAEEVAAAIVAAIAEAASRTAVASGALGEFQEVVGGGAGKVLETGVETIKQGVGKLLERTGEQ